MTSLPSIVSAEYDLNLFYAENYSVETNKTTWDKNLTCQPSIYVTTSDSRVLRYYLDAFKLNRAQTKSIAHYFPGDEWGSDFFIALELFNAITIDRDASIDEMLAKLPDPMTIDLSNDKYINWIN